MADDQQAPIGADLGGRLDRTLGVEAAGQGRVRPQQLALRAVPLGRSELRSCLRACLGAEEHGVKARSQAPQGQARGPRLALPARGQPALGVGARAVRLGLGMP